MAREIGAVALPAGVRRSQLYQNLVDATLRYLTEKVGGVEPGELGVDIPDDDMQPFEVQLDGVTFDPANPDEEASRP